MSNNPNAGREFTNKVITNADGIPTEVEIVEIVHGGLPTAGSSAVYDNIKSSNGVNVKRESGWYRVEEFQREFPSIRRYYADDNVWIDSNCDGDMIEVDDSFYVHIYPQMVMTPEGELVYHKAEHDPLYNTQQEG